MVKNYNLSSLTMDDCIFCKIVKGDIPIYKIYENEKVLAFLDIKPLSKGHTLVLTKEHYENIHDIPESLLCEVSKVVKMVANNIDEKLHPEGIIIRQNNKESAGQTIMHYHVHVKPIYEDTPRVTEAPYRKALSEEDMKSYVDILKMDSSAPVS